MAVIIGTPGPDALIGTPSDDSIFGLDGNDSLLGLDGNDRLDGGPGNDSLVGGTGSDRYFVESGDTVIELDGEGLDIVYARTSYVLSAGAYVELLAAISGVATDPIDLTGNELDNVIQGNAGNNFLTGGAGEDYLSGFEGNDRLDGGTGIDYLAGGTGDDRYYVDSSDRILELDGEGFDIAYARTNYALSAGAYVELLAAVDGAATDPISLTGNELNNVIQGNAGNNFLTGLDGDDYLVGLGGNDRLDGGAGADILEGGTGGDRYFVDGADRIFELTGEGFDIAYARTDYVLTAGAEVELLAAVNGIETTPLSLTGNELANTIQGNAGANVLSGAEGNDHLTGLAGNDTLDGGLGADALVGGAGADSYRFSDVSHSPLGNPDRINDFEPGIDVIDLSLIDADSNTPGDDAFTFVGNAAFTGTAGELRYDVLASGTHVYGDTDGDGVADLHFVVVNVAGLTGGDFIP